MTLNQCHAYNFPVCAKIEELSLDLSSKTIILMEQCSDHTNSGITKICIECIHTLFAQSWVKEVQHCQYGNYCVGFTCVPLHLWRIQ